MGISLLILLGAERNPGFLMFICHETEIQGSNMILCNMDFTSSISIVKKSWEIWYKICMHLEHLLKCRENFLKRHNPIIGFFQSLLMSMARTIKKSPLALWSFGSSSKQTMKINTEISLCASLGLSWVNRKKTRYVLKGWVSVQQCQLWTSPQTN